VRVETLKQLADRVGISPGQVRHLVQSGRLQHVRIGARRFVPRIAGLGRRAESRSPHSVAPLLHLCGLRRVGRRDVMHNHSGGDELTDLVRSIADLLKPWRAQLTQSEVFDEIKCKIYRLKDPRLLKFLSSIVGSRRRNRQEAKKLFVLLRAAAEQVTTARLTFSLNLRRSNQDQLGLWQKQTKEKNIFDEFHEVLSAGDPRLGLQKLSAAFTARLLMEKLSRKKPTVSSHGNTPFCVIASQLYEAVGGERDCDLIRACRRVRNFR
jgi:hypothetical protein